MTSIEVLPVTGLGEIVAGDDLAALIVARFDLRDGDVLVVSSKIVSKALGLSVAAPTRDGAIARATVRVVAARRTPRGLASIVQAEAGPVMAAAGVDNSNVEPGTILLLPSDPDACARTIRSAVAAAAGVTAGVIISDTAGRPWRDGQTDFALGAAGVAITDDLRGMVDTHGQPMEVTVRAVADELAAAADLVKGKLSGVPVAVVRGVASLVLPSSADGPGAASLLRASSDDWFRFGHVEAVRASLGVPSSVEVPSVPRGPVAQRLARVLAVAQAAVVPGWPSVPVTVDLDGEQATVRVTDPARPSSSAGPEGSAGPEAALLALGALAQAVSAAAWTEDLPVSITPLADGGADLGLLVVVRA